MDTTNEKQMKERLIGAGKLAEDAKVQRRQRAVKGSHLLGQLVEKAKAAGEGLTVKDNNGFFKFTGPTKGRSIYIAKKGGRVDLSGFTVDSEGIRQITEESAREKHLGKVRGQLDFGKTDEVVLTAFDLAVTTLAAGAVSADVTAAA
jgi:hypothetical protein